MLRWIRLLPLCRALPESEESRNPGHCTWPSAEQALPSCLCAPALPQPKSFALSLQVSISSITSLTEDNVPHLLPISVQLLLRTRALEEGVLNECNRWAFPRVSFKSLLSLSGFLFFAWFGLNGFLALVFFTFFLMLVFHGENAQFLSVQHTGYIGTLETILLIMLACHFL